jgi:hypothetical protein
MRCGIGLFLTTVLAVLIMGVSACDERSPTQPEHTVQFSHSNGNHPGFVFPDGCCYYDGRVVRTVVPPAANPRRGRDNFYAVPGQKGVVAVAPGDRDYHGGHWKFHAVAFNVAPYLLTSEDAVLAAADVGDVTVTRVSENDFKCPIQP